VLVKSIQIRDRNFWKQFPRVMIFGRPGNGKSTFSAKLHRFTGIPLYHIDRFFYQEHWVERPYQDFLNELQAIVDTEKWIIDGNGTLSLEVRYKKASLCLYFNYPRWQCYWRAFKRYCKKDPAILDRPPFCSEWMFQWKFIRYVWTFSTRVDPTIAYLRARYPQVRFVEICSDADLKNFESQLKK